MKKKINLLKKQTNGTVKKIYCTYQQIQNSSPNSFKNFICVI